MATSVNDLSEAGLDRIGNEIVSPNIAQEDASFGKLTQRAKVHSIAL